MRSEEASHVPVAVLFAVALLMIRHAAQAFDEISLKKLKALNGCEGCDLSGADLRGANFTDADLKGANLHGANLSRANLSGANLSNADLFGANLSRADLTGADLTGAVYLKFTNIRAAKLCKTKTPWGIDNSGCKKK